MVARCLHSGCGSEFASASQLDVHVAFKHVPVEEITFTCAKCKAQFHTGTMLLKHKMDTHQDVDDAAVSPSLCHVLAGGQHTLTDDNGAPADNDKENATPNKKPRYQCNRCPYGTEHSAWLLQKHVIYEHLVDALGGAKDYDEELDVPQVAKPKRRRRRRSTGDEEPAAEQLVFPADAYLGGVGDDGAPLDEQLMAAMAADYGGGDDPRQFDTEALDDYGGAPYEHEPTASPPVRAAKRAKPPPPQPAAKAKYQKCPQCPYATNQPVRLRNHMSCVHGAVDDGGGGDGDGHQPSTGGTAPRYKASKLARADGGGGLHQCHLCAFSHSKCGYLERHVAMKHGQYGSKRRLPCDVCGTYWAKRPDVLRKHRTRCIQRGGLPFWPMAAGGQWQL